MKKLTGISIIFFFQLIAISVNGKCKANGFMQYAGKQMHDLPGTIIIPASHFLHEIPKGNIITDAAALDVDWLFNNTGLVLKSETNMMTQIQVSEAGRYFLYVRSHGKKGSSFKIAVNDTVTDSVFGNETLCWRQGNSFELKSGITNVKITRIDPGSVLDVIVLTKNTGLKENDIIPYQLHDDVKLLKEYKIPVSGTVKFGDVNADGLTDMMVLTPAYSSHVFDNSGKELWSWKAPDLYIKERSEFEPPGVIWDFDRDGKAEIVQWRMIDEKEWLVIADGQTGAVKIKTEWPTKPLPHVYNNFRLAIGKLTTSDPNEVIVFTDMGGTIRVDAYNAALKPLWSHIENRKKDNLGHYVYPVDLNNDGIDEVLVGSLLLNAKGVTLWNRFALLNDNHDHADSYKFADIDKDGNTDIVTANSETGIFIYRGMTGEIIWQNVAEHTQQIQAGEFLKNVPGLQVVAGGRTYGNRQIGEPYLSSQLYWFDNKGKLILKWPGNPINGNPDFVKGDWLGNGNDQLFWYKFRINDSGAGELYFHDPVFHMFDFTGNGAEEVITVNRGVLRVYGSKNARYTNRDKKKDLNYLKNSVVNHTHY
ncbi:MAG: hypothetical protein H7122_02815 [Chitinophagaceae bacterium]|nr:hypothetical protein [Chitinophagaceae bacterium]